MSSIIQDARDVLAKWREKAPSPLPWAIESDGRDSITVDANRDDIVQLSSREVSSWASLDDDDARLIVGTAGNPELLDAIDRWLERGAFWATQDGSMSGLPEPTRAIAAAIIAADERMSS